MLRLTGLSSCSQLWMEQLQEQAQLKTQVLRQQQLPVH
jgi:hypothetical protein